MPKAKQYTPGLPYSEWPDLLTPGEVALIFRVDPKTVSRWAYVGRIDSTRTLTGRYRFAKEDVKAEFDRVSD